jgi:hypothetical protein
MNLTDQQKEFYGALEGTYRTPGWNLMVQGWTQERDSLSEIVFHNAKSMEDVFAARVRYGLLNELIGLAETHAANRAQIEEATEETDPYV